MAYRNAAPVNLTDVLVEISRIGVSPSVLTVGVPTMVNVGIGYSPANFFGELELIKVDENGASIETLATLNIPKTNVRKLINQENTSVRVRLAFDSIGTHRIRVIGAGTNKAVESQTVTIDVFPEGIPTRVSVGSLDNIVYWNGERVIGNRLHVKLKEPADFNLAQSLAESVGMYLAGYIQFIETWQFSGHHRGSAAELDKAYKALKENSQVLRVSPDSILRLGDNPEP